MSKAKKRYAVKMSVIVTVEADSRNDADEKATEMLRWALVTWPAFTDNETEEVTEV